MTDYYVDIPKSHARVTELDSALRAALGGEYDGLQTGGSINGVRVRFKSNPSGAQVDTAQTVIANHEVAVLTTQHLTGNEYKVVAYLPNTQRTAITFTLNGVALPATTAVSDAQADPPFTAEATFVLAINTTIGIDEPLSYQPVYIEVS